MLRFAADENFNNDIVRGVRRRSSEADIVRVQDVGLAGAEDVAVLEARERQLVLGTPEQVRDKLVALGRAYGVDEILVVTISHDFAARKRSYELLAEAFGLQKT